MDYAQISWNVVEILTPYLTALLDKQVMAANADQGEQMAYRLWKIVYPKISMRPTVMKAVKDLAADSNTRNRNALTMEITSVFMVNRYFAEQVVLTLESKHKDSDDTQQHSLEQPKTQYLESGTEQPVLTPRLVCQECGREDETIRLVNYPYVISIIFLTLRRNFSGLYCEKHARKYFLFAVLLTAAIGWIGIPFGIIFAPIALFSLLRADRKLDTVNAKIQRQIAETKLADGKEADAIKSIKRSLFFEVSNASLDLVKQIGGKYFTEEPPTLLKQFLTFLALLFGSLLIGLVLGVLNVLVSIPFWEFTTTSLIIVIFIWIPTIIIFYLGGYLVAFVVSEGINQIQLMNRFLAGLYGVVCAVLTGYAVNSGNFLLSMIYYSGFENMSFGQGFVSLLESLVNGGWYSLVNLFEFTYTSDVIWLVIFILGFILTIFLATRDAIKTANWHIILSSLTPSTRPRTSNTSALGWGTLAVFLITLFLFVFTLSPQGFNSINSELQASLDELYALLDAGEYEQARISAETLLESDPENLEALVALGSAFLYQGDCQSAIDPLSAGLEKASGFDIAGFQYALGSAYLCVGDLDSAEEYLLMAKEVFADDVWLLYYLGILYYKMGDFQSAVNQFEEMLAYEPNWATPYASLALAYANLGDHQAANEALMEAETLAEAIENDYSSLATYYLEVGEFEIADEYFSLGIEAFPTDSDYRYGKILSLLARGELEQAEAIFDQNEQIFLGSSDYYYLKGSLLIERGEFDAALRVYQEMEDAYLGNPNLQSHALTEMAYVSLNNGDYQTSLDLTEQAFALAPYNMSANSLLSYINYQLGNTKLACEQAQHVDEKDPLRAIQHYVLGLCSMDTGDETQAIEEFELFFKYSWNLNKTRMITEQVETDLELLQDN